MEGLMDRECTWHWGDGNQINESHMMTTEEMALNKMTDKLLALMELQDNK